jgi:hypothetical protein
MAADIRAPKQFGQAPLGLLVVDGVDRALDFRTEADEFVDRPCGRKQVKLLDRWSLKNTLSARAEARGEVRQFRLAH